MIGTYEYPCKTAKEVEFALKGRKNCEIVAYGDIILSEVLKNKALRRKVKFIALRRDDNGRN